MSVENMGNISFEDLEELREYNVQKIDSAVAAKVYDIKMLEEKVTEAFKKATIAKEAADNAKREVGLFSHGDKISKKEAIQRLQEAAKGLSDAQISAIEAQKILADYQQKTAQILKFLISIGTSSIAHTRAVIRSITELLKDGASEELSDLAKQELKGLLVDLKSKEDAFLAQSKIQNELREQKKRMDEQGKAQKASEQKQQRMDERLDEIMRKLDETEKREEALKKAKEKEEQKAREKKEQIARKKAARKEKALQKEKNRKPIVLKEKSKVVSGFLAIFLGFIGAQWFYLGKPIRAIVYFLVYLAFFPMWLLYMVEGIFFFCAKKETFDKYRGWSNWW